MSGKIKSAKKYTTQQQKLSFGNSETEEILASESFYDQNGNLCEEIKSGDDHSENERHVFEYDAQGKLIRHVLELTTDGISETLVYTRDEKGRVVVDQKFYGDDPGEKVTFEYHAHQQPVKIERHDPDGELESVEILTYDESDKLIQHQKFDAHNQIVETTSIAYNEKGLPSEKKVTDSDGNEISSTEITYDENGDVIRITEWNEQGKITSDVLSVYDERRNVTERKIKDFQSRTLKFGYDEHDNCIVEEVYDENGNLIRKHSYEFDDQKQITSETSLFLDPMRGGNFNNSSSRYEYEYWTNG
jgi:YD repeat-containing protein